MSSSLARHLFTGPRRRRAAAAALLAGAAFGIVAAASAQEGPGGAAPGADAGPAAGPGADLGMGPAFGPRGIDFAGIDTDGSGGLTRAELVDRARGRIAAADANGDGNLDRAELVAAMPGQARPLEDVFGIDRAARGADRLLAFFGASEAGSVTVLVIAERRADTMLGLLDTDRDGSVTEAEAAATIHRHMRPQDGRRGHDGREGPRRERLDPAG